MLSSADRRLARLRMQATPVTGHKLCNAGMIGSELMHTVFGRRRASGSAGWQRQLYWPLRTTKELSEKLAESRSTTDPAGSATSRVRRPDDQPLPRASAAALGRSMAFSEAIKAGGRCTRCRDAQNVHHGCLTMSTRGPRCTCFDLDRREAAALALGWLQCKDARDALARMIRTHTVSSEPCGGRTLAHTARLRVARQPRRKGALVDTAHEPSPASTVRRAWRSELHLRATHHRRRELCIVTWSSRVQHKNR